MADAPKHGEFCWNELITTDTDKAKDFYTKLLGWEPMAFPGDMPYTVFSKGEKRLAGMMAKTPEMGDVPPHWMAYIAVDDVDATAKQIEDLGGKICVPPMDIPNVGRMVAATDPTGAAICFITFLPMEK